MLINKGWALGLATVLPFLAWGLQTLFGDVLQPAPWFFFYPAIFAASWIAGRTGGLIATGISIALADYFLISPIHSFQMANISDALGCLMFGVMGAVFAFTQGHAKTLLDEQKTVISRLRSAFERAPIGLAIVDASSGRMVEVNPRFSEMLGKATGDLISNAWRPRLDPDHEQVDGNSVADLKADDPSRSQMNRQLLKADGSSVWVNMTVSDLSTLENKARCHLYLIEDITERLAKEKACVDLQAQLTSSLSRGRLAVLFQQRLAGVVEADTDQRLIRINERFLRLLGYKKEELLGKTIQELSHASDWSSSLSKALSKLLTFNEPFELEVRFLRKDATPIWVNIWFDRLSDEFYELNGIVGLIVDVNERKLLLERYRHGKQQLMLSMEAGHLGAWRLDDKSDAFEATARFRKVYGLPNDVTLCLNTLLDLVHPDDRASFSEHHPWAMVKQKQRRSLEYRIIRPDGEERWIRSHARSSNEGQATTCDGLVSDITEQKLLGQQLEELCLLMAEGESVAHLGSWSFEIKTQKITWSAEEYRILGCDQGECVPNVGVLVQELIHPDDLERVTRELREALQNKIRFQLDFRIIRPDGSLRELRNIAHPYFDTAGQVFKYVGTTLDMTERNQLEKKLLETDLRLRLATEGGCIGTWYMCLQSDAIDMSSLCQEHMGLSGDGPFSYSQVLSFLHPEDRDRVNETLHASLREHLPYSIEYRTIRTDGSNAWIQANGRGVYDEKGEPQALMGITADITLRKTAELALYDYQNTLRKFIQDAPASLAMFDNEMRYIAASERWKTDFDIEEQYIQGESHYELFPETTDRWKRAHYRGLTGETVSAEEERFFRSNGEEQWLKWELLPWRHQTGDIGGILIYIEDITERKTTIANLLESERRFRSLFEHLPIAYQSLDIEGRWLDANQPMANLLGFDSPDELIGQNFVDYWDDSVKDLFSHKYKTFMEEREVNGPIFLRRKDGKLITIQIAGRAQRDHQNRFIRTHCILIDITTSYKMEQEILSLNETLEKKILIRTHELQDALGTKSQFLASMSHEIRNPLNIISLNSHIVALEPLSERQRKSLSSIQKAGRTLLSIVEEILDFSKLESGNIDLKCQDFSVKDLLDNVHDLLSAQAERKKIDLVIEAAPESHAIVIGDMHRLQQVMVNLGSNAIKFTNDGEVRLSAKLHAESQDAITLRFEVSDTGIGIDPEVMGTLFDPFTQAKSTIGGTGLGLSISQRLVGLMGSEIHVNSTPGIGSIFWFEVLLEKAICWIDNGRQLASEDEKILSGAHILIVDDDLENLDTLGFSLEAHGANVTLTQSGLLAIDILRESVNTIDIVLMDIQMPVMDGMTASEIIRDELNLKKLPIIAVSAGLLPSQQQRALACGINHLVRKPIKLNELIFVMSNYLRR